jgi:large subunit ribosomal protein L6
VRNLNFTQKATWTRKNYLSESHVSLSRNPKPAITIYTANKINRDVKPFLFEQPDSNKNARGPDTHLPRIYKVVIPSTVSFYRALTKKGLQLIFISQRGDLRVLIPLKFRCTLLNRTLIWDPVNSQFSAEFRTLIGALYRAMLGVTKGYQEKLKTVGVGYKARFKENRLLKIALGYSHPVHYLVDHTVDIKLSRKNNRFNLRGPNLIIVNQAAADLYNFKKPDVYKGKGLRYRGFKLLKKEGKKKK